MNAIHIHLLLNHVPILGTFFGLVLLAAGLFKNNRTLIVTALVTFVATALIAIPTNMSGGEAEHTVGKLSGVDRRVIHEHEDSTETAFISVLVVGAIALAALFLTRGERMKFLPLVILVLSLGAFILMTRAGLTGGRIRHTEINSTTAPAPTVDPDGD